MTLSIKDCLLFGWNTFKLRPWFFVSVALLVLAVSLVSGTLQGVLAAMFDKTLGGALSFLLALIVNTFVSLGVIAVYLKAHDHVDMAALSDLWHPELFVRYLVTIFLVACGTIIGLVLLIVPGIIFAIACGFARFIIVERDVKPLAALKESARLTKGNRLNLFGLMLVLIVVNIVGALALLVGLFVSIPVSVLALVHAYRTLSGAHPESPSLIA
jgi:uncharacterized membrane protein